MVLRLLAVIAVAGCGQSLFDNHVGDPDGGGGGSNDGNNVASSCPMGCIGDAAADLDGSRPGWRYVEDNRNRTWTPMSAAGGGYVGTIAENTIKRCASGSSEGACGALPGALLVSTAGASTAADPALEFTSASNQVVQLTVRVNVPSGQPEQRVRLYRNSREDVLFTAPATAGSTFERAITVDALMGDRFLLALTPTAAGATEVGVQVYINTTADAFPKDCQLAVSFANAVANNVPNACGAVVNYREWDDQAMTSNEVAPQLAAGPFAEQGMAADIPMPRYYLAADVLPRSTDTTTQLWVRHDMFDTMTFPNAATAFSDVDLNSPYGGVQIAFFDSSGTKMLEASTCTGETGTTLEVQYTDVTWPNDNGWHFIRVVHTGGQVRLCIDGVRVGSYALAAGKMQSSYAPRMGRNVVWTPIGAFFDGGIDDVRSFAGALPCDP